MLPFETNFGVEVDAYQAGHFELIPAGMADFQCSQGVFRKPLHYGGDERADNRLISAGTAPFAKTWLSRILTHEAIDEDVEFFSTFHADTKPPYHKPYPFPEQMLRRVVDEFGGHLPVTLLSLADGQAHYVGEPHSQVFCGVEGMGELVGWIESSMLPYQWVSTIVATRGRVRKEAWINVLQKIYPKKSRDDLHQMVAYNFHDFGRRGGPSTQISGIAHLINWLGTDTCDAAFAAWKFLNAKRPFGACSVMASAHRTVTPWPTEDDSIRNAVNKYKDGIFSQVADSYDYEHCLELLSGYAEIIKVAGGKLVGRPDSGDIVETVITGLRVFEKGFGINQALTDEAGGLKTLNNCAILQGDGVSDRVLFEQLIPAVIAAGYNPLMLVIGMGEYNHRAVRSDTEEGYKTCLVGVGNLEYPAWRRYGNYAQVMKGSKNLWKMSIPVPVGANYSGAAEGNYSNRVRPVTVEQLRRCDTGDLFCYYDGRVFDRNRKTEEAPPKLFDEDFLGTRGRAWRSWNELVPTVSDTFDPVIRTMQRDYLKNIGASLAAFA
jgi:nicotinamide phosphoribosyltransferase